MGLLNIFAVVSLFVYANAELVNEDVNRVIDLRSHLVKVTTTVTLKNDKSGPTTTFRYTVDPSHAKQLAYIAFTKSDDDSTPFKMVESDPENKIFVVTLPSKLEAEGTTKFKVEEVYAQAVTPFPKEITQSQNQLVVYRGNHFYYSPYVTESQTTTIDLPSSTVESFSKQLNPDKEGSQIKFGDSKEFENVAPLTQNGLKVHYENNSPFLTITKLTRIIEVSHWGNIAVEEHLDIRHTGAKLKGSFSRYDFQRMPNSGVASVKSFKTILPAAAADVYYRDEIGNISTSNLYETEDSVDFEIRPRYPLFGGWKTSYYIGYNLPSYNYLYSRGDILALRMRFLDHVMDDQLVEDFTLKIILPEGAKNIKVKTPYSVNHLPNELHHTYLDTVGRPVMVMKKNNMLEQHIDEFVLSYNFNRLLLLQEPLLVVGAFFLLFFTVIILVRLDFSIAYDGSLEAKLRINGIMEQVQDYQAQKNGCYKAYEDAIAKYKTGKDSSTLQASRKNIDKKHKDASQAITKLTGKIKDDSADVADKISSLNQMDSTVKDKLGQRVVLAEKLVNQKISRVQYTDQDEKLQKSIAQLRDQINDICEQLVV